MSRPTRWRVVLAGFCIIAVGVLIVWRMTLMKPVWYSPPSSTDETVIELADRVEFGIVKEAQQVRDGADKPWTLRVRESHINAWLSARLKKWVTRDGAQWPANLGTPQVRIMPDGISVAIPLLQEEDVRFITARITPTVANGAMHLELNRVQLGRISLPGEPLANLLETLSDAAPQAIDLPQFATAIQWLRQRESIEPVFTLSDGRQVCIKAIGMHEGAIDITATTESQR